MSKIPYGELQSVECTAKTEDERDVVIGTLYYAFVIPCRDCRHYKQRKAILPSMVCERFGYYSFPVKPDGFCAWGERRSE